MPIATARATLSPPTAAFALAAAPKSPSYLTMKYTAPGSVPSVGLALPTLIGSALPTSHSRAMDVSALSSANSSLDRSDAGSSASATLSSACFTLSLMNESLDSAATASIAARERGPLAVREHRRARGVDDALLGVVVAERGC